MNRRAPLLLGVALLIAVGLIVYLSSRTPTAAVAPAPNTAAAPESNPPADRARASSSPLAPSLPRAVAPSSAVVFRARWGAGFADVGRRRDPESSAEAPMALAAARPGELALLDQVNRRVIRRSADGKTTILPMATATAQDVTLGRLGVAVLDRLGGADVELLDRSGQRLPLVGRGLREGAQATGLFVDEDGSIYVEREHGTLLRLADGSGQPDEGRREIPGRPTRDGRLFVSAAIAERGGRVVSVRAFDRTGRLRWQRAVELPSPVLHLVMLDSDRRGRIYVAAETGRESPAPPFAIVDEAMTVVRLSAEGAPESTLDLRPTPTGDEMLRPLAVDDDGGLYQMIPGEDGFEIVRYQMS